MIDVGLKICLIFVLFLIFWQDTKERLVFWFLYPSAGIIAYAVNAKSIGMAPAIVNSLLNLALVLLIVVISYLYVVAIKKGKFLNESIGSGDMLFFICLPFTFSTVAFIVLFVFSLVFSLILHLIFKAKQEDKTVPLAGYIALFFSAVYIISFFTEPRYLFSY